MQNKKVILIVEDEPDFVEICKSLLEETGYEILVAINGKQGIEAIQKNHVDMILSDGKMPLSDGYTLLNWVRSHCPNMPFILMTGYLERSEAEFAQLGIDGMFEKPFDLNILVKFIENFFEYDEAVSLRRYPRVNVKIPITFKDDGQEFEGVCLNISRGGLFVAKAPPYPELNSPIHFSMKEAGVSGTGVIRWQRERADAGKLPGVGIEFSNIDLRQILNLNQSI